MRLTPALFAILCLASPAPKLSAQAPPKLSTQAELKIARAHMTKHISTHRKLTNVVDMFLASSDSCTRHLGTALAPQAATQAAMDSALVLLAAKVPADSLAKMVDVTYTSAYMLDSLNDELSRNIAIGLGQCLEDVKTQVKKLRKAKAG